ncbi:PREDICTED: DNA repair protein XRCC4-like isoform X1 [Branchiostoma belcheri]|uniref:DNA repair protein XRCC4-like isoform X1 n=1 Tax=Branchiostoma belcheri TaxID=7741 RepID=A0A6P4YKX5_BRABE|nr:PREDICTED: DNA repair protein XRCC4-like isoform X1 [Branchiostoma belcheri]XP_019622354.1 PREDICTED: DNA repair protein XRCC4-like isoform X1 [Branchiostoma belcheri]
MRTLCKLQAGGQPFYLLTNVLQNGREGFQLTLSDGLTAWTGHVDGDDMHEMAVESGMEFETFVTESVRALTRENMGDITFHYAVEIQEEDVSCRQFSWKKYIPSEKVRFQLGSIKLREAVTPVEVMQQIFDHALGRAEELKRTISDVQKEKDRLSGERAKALERLEKYVAQKEEMERDLYAKFVVVVNDKKAKIRQLKDELAQAREMAATQSSSRKVSQTTKQDDPSGSEDNDTDNNPDSEDNDDDDDGDTTDEERPRRKVWRNVGAGGGHLDLELGGEDNDGADLEPAAKRRRRREPAPRKDKAVSRPTIPKGTSSQRSLSGDRTSPSGVPRIPSRQSSGRSNRSGDLDPDDLFDEL